MKIFEITLFGITIGPTYYALMYILGLSIAWFFMKKIFSWKKTNDLDDLFFLLGLGIIIGGRLGYVLLYNASFYFSHPIKIFAIYEGGMSFHGGLLGVILATWYFCYSRKYSFWKIIDLLAVITPIGLGLGRFGNYLNNELYGYANYSGPFPMIVNGVSHFPSPLLEMFLEGIILFIGIFSSYKYNSIRSQPGKLSGIFLIGYGISRFFVEFFRLPDSHIGYLFGTNFLTIGMIYTLPMIIFGIFLCVFPIEKITKTR